MPILKTFLFLLITFLFSGSIAPANEIQSFLQDRKVITSIYFQTGDSQLSNSQMKHIRTFKGEFQKLVGKGRLIRIEGHASAAGLAMDNHNLSMQRAVAVYNAVEGLQLSDHIFFTGYGENNSETAKMSEQRRVDIVAYRARAELKKLFLDSSTTERFIIQ